MNKVVNNSLPEVMPVIRILWCMVFVEMEKRGTLWQLACPHLIGEPFLVHLSVRKYRSINYASYSLI